MNTNNKSIILVKNDNKKRIDLGFSKRVLLCGPIQFFKDNHFIMGLVTTSVYLLAIVSLITDFDTLLLLLFIILHVILAFYSYQLIIAYSFIFRGYKPFSEDDKTLIKNIKFFKNWNILD